MPSFLQEGQPLPPERPEIHIRPLFPDFLHGVLQRFYHVLYVLVVRGYLEHPAVKLQGAVRIVCPDAHHRLLV